MAAATTSGEARTERSFWKCSSPSHTASKPSSSAARIWAIDSSNAVASLMPAGHWNSVKRPNSISASRSASGHGLGLAEEATLRPTVGRQAPRVWPRRTEVHWSRILAHRPRRGHPCRPPVGRNGPHGPGARDQGGSMSESGTGSGAGDVRHGVHRLRPLPAQRPAGPAHGDLRQARHPARRPAPPGAPPAAPHSSRVIDRGHRRFEVVSVSGRSRWSAGQCRSLRRGAVRGTPFPVGADLLSVLDSVRPCARMGRID